MATDLERLVALRNEGNAAVQAGDVGLAEAKYTASLAVSRGEVTGPLAAEAVKTHGNRAALRLMRDDPAGARADAAAALHIQPCYARGMVLYANAETALGREKVTWPLVSAAALDERFCAEARKVRDRQAATPSFGMAAAAKAGGGPAWTVRSGEDRKDRALIAARDLLPGEVVIAALPPVAVAPDDPSHTCRRCAKEIANSAHWCKKCKFAHYCSRGCQAADAAAHTAAECEAFATLQPLLPPLKAAAGHFGIPVAKLVGMGYLPAGASAEGERELHGGSDESAATVDVDDLAATAAFCLSTAFRLAHAAGEGTGGWNDVLELEGRAEATDPAGPCSRGAVNLAAARLAAAAVAASGKAQRALDALLSHAPWLAPEGEAAGRHSTACESVLQILQTNAFEVNDALALVPPPLAWVNHSCYPNAAKGDSGALIATRRIREGDEICTSYIADLMQPRGRRRRALRHLHGFDCACARCAFDANAAPSETSASVLVGNLPLADAQVCPRCGNGWVSVSEGSARDCAACGATVAWEEVRVQLAGLETEVERIGPVLHGGMDSLNDIDQELLEQLAGLAETAREVLHPCHWLTHRIHAYLIRPALALKKADEAAAHSLAAYAAMDATMQCRWPGKGARAEYIAENYAALPPDTPAYLTGLYSEASLRDSAAALRQAGLQ
eukprot:TRINITY_DN13563_c0_g1_i1.p1 TRINITY_DN13563_c0_g1~~TRINITY_DN13563_c0_g1_i1.p1  ORF type:complete len:693 (+),score=190.83 TRINITY_DN13563_c0_g1_i1:60-2081(+)